MKDIPVQQIELARISVEGFQTRAGLRESAVEDYTEKVKSGEEFDPVLLIIDGERLYLSAGHHRFEAYKRAGRRTIPAEVRAPREGQDPRLEAIRWGIYDNLQHRGERLTAADNRHNIRLMLKEKPDWSDRMIAGECGASDKTVARYRDELGATSEIPESSTRVGRDSRKINTAGIGRSPVVALPQASDRPPVDSGTQQDEPAEDAAPVEEDDFLAQIPPRPPLLKPANDYFHAADQQLGKLTRTIDEIANVCSGPLHERAMVALRQVSAILTKWKRQEEFGWEQAA